MTTAASGSTWTTSAFTTPATRPTTAGSRSCLASRAIRRQLLYDRQRVSFLLRAEAGQLQRAGAQNQHYADIAASIQEVTEEIVLKMAPHAYRPVLAHLCLAGGVALNSVANGRIIRETPFERSSSSRRPVTAAARSARRCTPTTWCSASRAGFVLEHAYWGEESARGEINDFLREATSQTTRSTRRSLLDRVVERLEPATSSAGSRDVSSGARGRSVTAASSPIRDGRR